MKDRAGQGGANARTQKERTEATRAALLRAARACFGQAGFHATSTIDLVAAASVTRGALYHHFADKEALFAVLAREVAQEVSDKASQEVLASEGGTWIRVVQGLEIYLRIVAATPQTQRILLIDGPAVLGWERWRIIQTEVVLPGTIYGLTLLMNNGTIRQQDPEPLAHLILAALNDAALMIAHASEPEVARTRVTAALMSLVGGLAKGA